ncbi:MAG: hypothetical protein JXB48_25045 [Candidatus Latescibacteria bacterium]|nr:hypothetical protein [Candidatus Latescibacterota bacterium]
MKQLVFMFVIISTFYTAPAESQNLKPASYPYVLLTNGQVSCSVFLPDREQGFYRSTRWEWSGMIWQLTYKGHTYFSERSNCTPHDPLNNEHAMSTAEEFGILDAIRFDEAKPGETFMKIGVGLLEKPEGDDSYHFYGKYRLVEPGTWSANYGDTWIEFVHTLHDRYGYSYTYRKRMDLVPGEPALLIGNSLENTGTQRLVTDQYNHNFFAIDNVLIGPDYRIDFTFTPTLSADFSPTAGVRDNTLVFFKDVEKALFTNVLGFGSSPEQNRVIITNTKTGAAVDIRGDYPLAKINFWTDGQVLSPEMFMGIDIAPGETVTWKRTYTFMEK